jgi:MFS family permease
MTIYGVLGVVVGVLNDRFGSFAIVVHIVPHAIELGISATSAATILSCRGGMGLVGNYVLGGIADRIGNRRIFIVGFIITLAAFFWLVPARELWMLYLFALIFGFAGGGMAASESPLVAGVFGLSSHGLIYGVVHLGFTAGAAYLTVPSRRKGPGVYGLL